MDSTYMTVFTCVWVPISIHVHVEISGWHKCLSQSHFYLIFPEQCLSLKLELTNGLDWLAVMPQGSSCLLLPSAAVPRLSTGAGNLNNDPFAEQALLTQHFLPFPLRLCFSKTQMYSRIWYSKVWSGL